jgi:hypothetical protein
MAMRMSSGFASLVWKETRRRMRDSAEGISQRDERREISPRVATTEDSGTISERDGCGKHYQQRAAGAVVLTGKNCSAHPQGCRQPWNMNNHVSL